MSILPPDLREKVPTRSAGGIGGAAMENKATAAQRAAIVDPEPESPKPEASEEDAKEKEREDAADKLIGEAREKLGVTFEEKDLEDYMFRGFVTREVPVLGRYKILVKSQQSKDHGEIDELMMTGDWAKDGEDKDRRVSDFYMTNFNAMCIAASCILKFDGESIGESLKERVAWMNEKGAALIDLLVRKTALFNNAVAAYLQKRDTLQGS